MVVVQRSHLVVVERLLLLLLVLLVLLVQGHVDGVGVGSVGHGRLRRAGGVERIGGVDVLGSEEGGGRAAPRRGRERSIASRDEVRIVGRGGRCSRLEVEQRLVRGSGDDARWLSAACYERAAGKYGALHGRRRGGGGNAGGALQARYARKRMSERVGHEVLLLLL